MEKENTFHMPLAELVERVTAGEELEWVDPIDTPWGCADVERDEDFFVLRVCLYEQEKLGIDLVTIDSDGIPDSMTIGPCVIAALPAMCRKWLATKRKEQRKLIADAKKLGIKPKTLVRRREQQSQEIYEDEVLTQETS